MRKALLFAGLVALAMLAASCRAEFTVGLEVEDDRSGAVIVEFGTDQELRDSLESLGGGSADDLTSALEAPDIEGAESYTREEGEMTFQGVRLAFDDISEIENQITDATDFAQFSTFSFDMDETSAVFNATMTPSDIGEFGDLPVDPSGLTGDAISTNFTLAMPGNVTSHNADEVLADGTLRWDLPLFGEAAELHAESEFGGSGFPWLILLLGVVVLVGVGAMIGAIVASRRREQDAVSAAAAAHGAQTAIEPDETADE